MDTVLKVPSDVAEMEAYIHNLVVEQASIMDLNKANLRNVFFMLEQEKMFEETTWELILALNEWPGKL